MPFLFKGRILSAIKSIQQSQQHFIELTPKIKQHLSKNRVQFSACCLTNLKSLLTFFTLVLTIFMFTGINGSYASNNALSAEQKAYLQAYKAIKRNDRKAIAKYKKQLKNYPLAIYLDYHDYRIHIKNTPNHQILAFIKKYKNSYLSERLYRHWLKNLAAKQHWTTYLTHYKPQKSKSLQCYYVQALANRKQLKKALSLAQPIWQNSTNLNKACRPLDKLLRNHKKLTGSMVWQRIELNMNKRKFNIAKKLSKDLSKKDRAMFDYWNKVVQKPQLVAQSLPNSIAQNVKKKIFTQGVRYLASRDPSLAKTSLEKFYKQYGLNKDQYAILKRKVALRTAYKYAPQAGDYLNEVNRTNAKSEDSLRWQAQVALKVSNWATLLETIELMPQKMQQKKQWRYWKARALEASGDKSAISAARDIYKSLSHHRDYYAFLSADKLGLDYQFNPNPVIKRDTNFLLKKYPELKRIQELMAIDWKLSSKREWYHLLNRVNRNELQAIAVLANQWQDHPQAIRSLAKAKEWNDIQLRFPVAHKEPIMQNADKNKIDPAWVYGVIRRESAFSEDIKSPVGAIGLMQIMPKTAKYIGNKIGVKKVSQSDLIQAENNIQLGSAYLSYLLDKFNGNKVMATAAYNAGPHRVDKWTPNVGSLPADQWIDSIPFTETRNYVKAVLEYTTIFKSLLNKRYDRLKDVMPAIANDSVNKTSSKQS